jgi:hypothetical protein
MAVKKVYFVSRCALSQRYNPLIEKIRFYKNKDGGHVVRSVYSMACLCGFNCAFHRHSCCFERFIGSKTWLHEILA